MDLPSRSFRPTRPFNPQRLGLPPHPCPMKFSTAVGTSRPGKMPLNPFGREDKVKMNPGTSPDVLDRPAGPTDPDVTVISVPGSQTQAAGALCQLLVALRWGRSRRANVGRLFRRVCTCHAVPPAWRCKFCGDDVQRHFGDINNIPFGVVRPLSRTV